MPDYPPPILRPRTDIHGHPHPRRHHPPQPPLRASRQLRLTPVENEVLNHLAGTMNVHELAAAIGASVNATQERLTPLRAKGAVTMTGGPGRDTTYTQVIHRP